MYVFMHVFIYLSKHSNAYPFICLYKYVLLSIYVYQYVNMCVYLLRAKRYVYICVCVYIYIYMYIHSPMSFGVTSREPAPSQES